MLANSSVPARTRWAVGRDEVLRILWVRHLTIMSPAPLDGGEQAQPTRIFVLWIGSSRAPAHERSRDE